MNSYLRVTRAFLCLALAGLLVACATKDLRRQPTPLSEIKPVLDIERVWSASVGKSGRYLFQPIAVGDAVYAAGANGLVAKFDAATGQVLWRAKAGVNLTAGVGSDGNLTAVGGQNGAVVVFGPDGALLWKAAVEGEIVAPPLVGNGYVLVRTIDGPIYALNASTGEQKWVYRNRAVPLNLRTVTGMTFAGDGAVLAGFPGGSMAAISLADGTSYWETPVSYPEGVTEVERVNDVAGAPTLVGGETCAATFQGHIGCFDVNTGKALWEQRFSSYGGVAQDASVLASADDRSVISLYDASSGRLLWRNDKLKNRMVTGPLLLGSAVAVGDYKGFVHFLSRETGDFVARVKTDGHAIIAPPILARQTLVVQTTRGNLDAFRPR